MSILGLITIEYAGGGGMFREIGSSGAAFSRTGRPAGAGIPQ